MSGDLFLATHNTPICTLQTDFYLTPGSRWRETIERNGGRVTLINAYRAVHLIPNAPNSITKECYEGAVYSEEYIPACVAAGELLPLSDFQVFAERVERCRKRRKLGQMEVNELLRFVREHPKQDREIGYWDWVRDNLPFYVPSDILEKAFYRHLTALRTQGYLAAEKTVPVVQITELKRFVKVVEAPCKLASSACEWSVDVLARFKQLVADCQSCTRAPVTESEVLRALLRNRGNTQRTIHSFQL